MIIALLALLAGAPASAATDGQFDRSLAEISAAARPKKPLGLGYLPKIAMVVEDQETDDWTKVELSRYDGLPIVGPKTPNKRLREVWVRLQETLNGLSKPPLVVAWDYYFPKAAQPESPATAELARLFDAAPFPLVLSGELDAGPLDTRVHHAGPNRWEGQISVWNDSGDKHFFSPTSPLDPALREVPEQDSLVVATVAAYLGVKRRLPREQALAQARVLAQQVAAVLPAEEKGTAVEDEKDPKSKRIEYDVKGIRMIERPVPIVSMRAVLRRDPDALKAVDGAIVLVGNTVTDVDDLFADGKSRSKGLVHAWTMLQLLGSRLY